VHRPHLVVGFFDPLDAATVTMIGRLAETDEVHLALLGDRYAQDGRALTPARERQEILGYVRGVARVTLVEDDEQLGQLVDGSQSRVRWLVPRRVLRIAESADQLAGAGLLGARH